MRHNRHDGMQRPASGRRVRSGTRLCALAVAGLGGLSTKTAWGQATSPYYWNPSGNDNAGGVWDTTTANWLASDGATQTTWANSSNYYAEFGDNTNGGVGNQSSLSTSVITVSNASSTTVTGVMGVIAGGLDFEVNGFNISGPGAIDFAGSNATVFTADGVSAIIAATMTNAGSVTYQDGTGESGYTIISGSNTYTGGTQIATGTILIDKVTNGGVAGELGMSSNAASNLTFNGSGSELVFTGTTANGTTDRGLTLAAGDDQIDVVNPNTVLTFSGQISSGTVGNMSFYKFGQGSLVFSNNGGVTLGVNQSAFLTNGNVTVSGTGASNLSNSTIYIGGQNTNPSPGDTVASLTLANGTFTAGRIWVGLSSSGTISTVDTLNLTSGAVLTTNNNDSIGNTGTGTTTPGIGVVNISGGAQFVHTASDFSAAEGSSTTAIINVSGPTTGGLFVQSGTLYIARGAGTTGIVNQTGGTVSETGSGDIVLGNSNGASGVYNMSGGVIATNDKLILGNANASTGTFVQTGGAVTLNNDLVVGSANGSTGLFNMSGGTLSVGGWIHPGNTAGAVGTITQTGGTITGKSYLLMNYGGASTATYNLAGGTLITANFASAAYSGGSTGTFLLGNGSTGSAFLHVPFIFGGSGTSTFIANGGTITPNGGSNATLIYGFNTAKIAAGGLIVNQYYSPYIYSDTISQNFTTGVSTGVDGGLTLQGGGTLTISGSNSYTGGTNITAGTLLANNATASLGTGYTTIQSGAALAGTGVTGGPVAVLSGGVVSAGSGTAASNAIGTLGMTTLNLSGGSYSVKFNGSSPSAATGSGASGTPGTANDELIITGLTTAGTGTLLTINPVAITGTALTNGSTYSFVIADDKASATAFNSLLASGAITVGPTNAAAGYSLDTISDGGTGEDLLLEFGATTATPEPTSALLVGMVATPLIVGRRRRQRSNPTV